MKKLNEKQKNLIYLRIKRLLLAGLDYCENTNKDSIYWFSSLNPYYCEAFGMLHTLEILGYGYFGAVNVDAEGNLKYWFYQIKDEVKQMGIEFGPKNAYLKFINENV